MLENGKYRIPRLQMVSYFQYNRGPEYVKEVAGRIMISDEQIGKIRKRLVDAFAPEKIILFGSQARGTADNRSDVDILVICSFEGRRRHLMLDMDRALHDLDYAFDVLILTPEEFQKERRIPGTIGRYAQLEGRVLYAQS